MMHIICKKISKKNILEEDLESYRSKTVLSLEDRGSFLHETEDEETLELYCDFSDDNFSEGSAKKRKNKKISEDLVKVTAKSDEDFGEIMIHQ